MTQISLLTSAASCAFLDAFRPLASAGTLSFPVVQELPNETAGFRFSQRELTRETIPDFIGTASRLLREVEDVVSEGGSVEGPWAIGEFGSMGPSAFANLVRASGEFLFLADTEDVVESFMGRRIDGILYGLANTINPRKETVSSSYHLACLGNGTVRLRERLNMRNAPLSEVAAVLSGIVCSSGQYPSGLRQDWMTLEDIETRKFHTLGGPLSDSVTSARKINVTLGGPAGASGGVLIPEAFEKGAGEYFSLMLQDEERNGRGEATPLHPDLLRYLIGLSLKI